MARVHHAHPVSYTHTLRITVAYDDEKLAIAGVKRVAMRAPAPATPPPQKGQTGYWLMVEDENGEVLYHRPLYDPIHRDVEVFGDKPGEPLRRVPARHLQGEFEVLVPDLPEAAVFALYGPPAGKPTAPSKALIRHATAELRRLAGGNGSGTQGGTP